jgi:hypothetical protein
MLSVRLMPLGGVAAGVARGVGSEGRQRGVQGAPLRGVSKGQHGSGVKAICEIGASFLSAAHRASLSADRHWPRLAFNPALDRILPYDKV